MRKLQDSQSLERLVASFEAGRVIVDFTGSYCSPCRQLEPILAALAEEFRGNLEVVTIDIEAHPELAQRYGVRSVPTLLALHNGTVRSQQVGFSQVRRVREMFTELARLP